MSSIHLWLREEVKEHEKRTALTPENCKKLLGKGFKITVEKFADRCVADAEYEAVGCTIVEGGTWPNAPADAYIVGLKELPEDGSPLKHKHIYFAHCFKEQGGWKELLGRFDVGGGHVLDIEFLTNEKNQRVAAFGFMAGFAGAAVGLMTYCAQNTGTTLGLISSYPNEAALLEKIGVDLKAAEAKAGKKPRAIIMGALGRCGSGAVSFLEKAGFAAEQIVKWDMAETKGGGPFPALMEHDIFINCIYLSKPIPPFLTEEMLNNDARQMSVLVDVSCDTSNPHNPLPFCNVDTTFDKPLHRITPTAGPALDIVAIDHLPTLLPLESSQHFSNDLMPTIEAIETIDTYAVWVKAKALFDEKMAASKM